MNRTSIITITGPSCGGKTHLANSLVSTDKFIKVVSFTSRRPREGEVDGVDYYFKSMFDAEEIVFTGQDVEHNFFKGNYYGIETRELFRKAESDKLPVVILDPTGVNRLVRDGRFNCLTVYLDCPIILLYERFLNRFKGNTNSDSRYEALRLMSMHEEKMKWKSAFDYELVFNEFSEDTEREIVNKLIEYTRL